MQIMRSYHGVDFHVKAGLLHLELSGGICNLCVSIVLGIHPGLLAFCFLWAKPNPVKSALQHVQQCTALSSVQIQPLTLMPASLLASATPISASLLTLAHWALPKEARYSTLSYTSLMVKLRISMPMRPTSGAATSLTSWANWSLSW